MDSTERCSSACWSPWQVQVVLRCAAGMELEVGFHWSKYAQLTVPIRGQDICPDVAANSLVPRMSQWLRACTCRRLLDVGVRRPVWFHGNGAQGWFSNETKSSRSPCAPSSASSAMCGQEQHPKMLSSASFQTSNIEPVSWLAAAISRLAACCLLK